MKPHRLLIPIVAVCLLLASVRDSRSAVQEQAPDLAPSRVQAQPNAPLIPRIVRYDLYHPRFYKEYGELGLSSTLYVQNAGSRTGTYVLMFYKCDSGTLVYPPAPPDWAIPPRATRVAGPGDFPDLAPGCYGLDIVSDLELGPSASVVEDTWSGGSATDKLATHAGFAEDEAAFSLRVGPFLKGDVNSTVHVWNIDPDATTTVTTSAYSASGSKIKIDLPPCTLSPYAQCTFDVSVLADLSTPFSGTLVIQSTGRPVLGIMTLNSTSGDVNEYRKPLEASVTGACLPRALKHVNEGGVVRSTTLFVANSTDQAANANLVFYDSNGTPVAAASQSFSLAANGSRYLKLTEMAGLPNGTWSVCASGDRPLALEELTQADSPPTSPASSGTRGVTKLGSIDSFAVTHLMRSDASYTAFSVQNTGTGAADVEVKYYDVSGTLVSTDSVKLPSMGWARFDQSTQCGLGNGFVGSPVLSSNQPLVSLVDEYVSPPPSCTYIYLPLVLR